MITYGLSLYTIIYATLYSILEIEIEGKDGWAINLPTFKINSGIFTNFTFYHIVMNIIVIGTNMYPIYLLKGVDETYIDIFLQSIYMITLWFFIEDFEWFILNPHYTIKNYGPNIPWHSNQRWFLGKRIPMHNVISYGIMSGIAYYKTDWMMFIILVYTSIFIILTLFLAPIYHRFYLKQNRQNVPKIYYSSDIDTD